MSLRLADKARLKWDRRENQYVLLSPERGLKLSESAAAILLKCDGTRSLETICEELAAGDAAKRGTIAKDVEQFLLDMQHRGLVVT